MGEMEKLLQFAIFLLIIQFPCKTMCVVYPIFSYRISLAVKDRIIPHYNTFIQKRPGM